MIRGKRWLLPILYMHFIHIFIISIKQPTSTYKAFTLLYRSRAIRLYKVDEPIFLENLRLFQVTVRHFRIT